MPYRRKTWTEKLDSGKPPAVTRAGRSFAGIPAGASMLIPNPRLVQAEIEEIPPGRSMSAAELRQCLARRFNAEATCPLTTGIFLRIIAEAAWEQIAAGRDPATVTPFWRILGPKDPVTKKLSFGATFVTKMRAGEGIQ